MAPNSWETLYVECVALVSSVLYLLCFILCALRVSGSLYLHDILRTRYYLVFVSCSASNIELFKACIIHLQIIHLLVFICEIFLAFVSI
jgi:hypothetical protein